MDSLLQRSATRAEQAWALLERLDVLAVLKRHGLRAELVGSLRTGLLLDHLDIDLHLYGEPFSLAASFAAIGELAAKPGVRSLSYLNQLDTEELCVEWHLCVADAAGRVWQLDLIHLRPDSKYVGVFERVAERIKAALTEETRLAILRIKSEIPPGEKAAGIEITKAVMADGVRGFAEFQAWRAAQPIGGILHWEP